MDIEYTRILCQGKNCQFRLKLSKVSPKISHSYVIKMREKRGEVEKKTPKKDG